MLWYENFHAMLILDFEFATISKICILCFSAEFCNWFKWNIKIIWLSIPPICSVHWFILCFRVWDFMLSRNLARWASRKTAVATSRNCVSRFVFRNCVSRFVSRNWLSRNLHRNISSRNISPKNITSRCNLFREMTIVSRKRRSVMAICVVFSVLCGSSIDGR